MLAAVIHFQQESWEEAFDCSSSAVKVLEAEGVDDEEQAARVQVPHLPARRGRGVAWASGGQGGLLRRW